VIETSEGRTRVGAYACCRDGDRVLLCRLSPDERAAGSWTLPGGGIDFGEHPADAVLRELTEETGLVGVVERLLTVESYTWPAEVTDMGVPFQAIFIVYEVRIVGGELRDELHGSTDRCAWLSPAEIAEVRLSRIAQTVLAGERPAA
jgi:8-oxo-dGTP diphosphatase